MTKWSLDAMKRGSSAYDSMCWMLRGANVMLVDIILKFKTIVSICVLEDVACCTPFVAKKSCLLIKQHLSNRKNDDGCVDYPTPRELRKKYLFRGNGCPSRTFFWLYKMDMYLKEGLFCFYCFILLRLPLLHFCFSAFFLLSTKCHPH